ncbi:MAG: hypothetical protein RLY20_898 [Verrucomicrobiota bacterium]|jgi:PST family polysaccharide transporter
MVRHDVQPVRQMTHQQQLREQLFSGHGAAAGDLKKSSVRSGAITVVAQGLRFVLQTGAIMVLARLLSDEDYGVQAMVLAVTGVCNLFKDGGLSMATVQREKITHEQTSSLFWVNVVIGIVLMIALAALAPALAWYNKEPRVFWAIVVSSSGFFFSGLGVQHQALLQRFMRFKAIALIDICVLVVSSGAAIVMAKLGCRYWALVAQAVLIPLVGSVGAWLAVRWVPGLPKRGAGVKSMLQFGGTSSLNNIIVYLAYYSADKLIIGRMGTALLGLYNRASSLISLPTMQLQSAIFNVAFSALSKLQGDPGRLSKAFLRGMAVVVSMTLPLMVVCSIYPSEVVTILLGKKWVDCAPIFQMLAPAQIVVSVMNPMGWLLYATGRAKRSLFMAFVIAPVVVAGMWIGRAWGPIGVAIGYSIAMGALLFPLTTWAIHGTGIGVRDFWRTLGVPAIAAGAAALAGLGFKHLGGDKLPTLAFLILGSAVVIVVFAVVLLFVLGQRAFYTDLMGQILHRKPKSDSTVQPESTPA